MITQSQVEWVSSNSIIAIERIFSPRTKKVLGEEKVQLKVIAVNGDYRIIHWDELAETVFDLDLYGVDSILKVR